MRQGFIKHPVKAKLQNLIQFPLRGSPGISESTKVCSGPLSPYGQGGNLGKGNSLLWLVLLGKFRELLPISGDKPLTIPYF